MSLLDSFEPVQYRNGEPQDVADQLPIMVWDVQTIRRED